MAAPQRVKTLVAWALHRWPVTTNITTGALLGAAGDVVCQRIVEQTEVINRRRLFAMTVFGGAYVGGAATFVYRLYPRLIAMMPTALRATPTRNAVTAMLLDQVVHCPLVYTPAFYISTNVLQGSTVEMAIGELRAKYVESVVACAGFWVPFMFANFRYMPPALHVLTMQGANLAWTVIIDYIAHRSNAADCDRTAAAT
mmetsp:Transcript_8491/g.21781  ORF Transcript_8491/g.21781 Transcript_8491/m.21781 type:complete len:199 (-) Transcript_8491:90-686(-)|eukprot:CAMPEP_0182927840 /NCGR_PEP_ID=MMETSP0105_2-20130417/14387_1 /TAXON_ID=81532 ORGANISM="Acanthoeca-like sp., Strain 10tr" /NCGR_SAMPLE_ID=MMETSP0105_2 /ASSEMBLY_ACC=CAM_ASM_000205 /LENGTH=198 /DNA_ID=CAMNT_0025065809 /DNA_START=265 /DNA_END=861 /DNA_ORIENTATION=-